jgi:hypothetical protein
VEGHANTDMPHGPEPTFDVQHVASTIVHIASMPPDVAMLEVNIMCDRGYFLHGNIHLTKEYVGRLVYYTSVEVNATQRWCNSCDLKSHTVQITMDYDHGIRIRLDNNLNSFINLQAGT